MNMNIYFFFLCQNKIERYKTKNNLSQCPKTLKYSKNLSEPYLFTIPTF